MPDSNGATNGWDVLRDVAKFAFDWRFLVFVGAVLIGLGLMDAGPLANLTGKVIEVIRAVK